MINEIHPLFDRNIIKDNLKRVVLPGDKIDRLSEDVLSLEEKYITKGKKTGNEENVKIKLVLPILEFLGYDQSYDLDFEEHAYKGSIDIAIKVSAERKKTDCLIEVKYWKKDLDKLSPEEDRYKNDVQQGLIYSAEKGIDWFIITNGFEWRLYKTHIPGQNVYNFFERFTLDDLKNDEMLKKFYFLCSNESPINERLTSLFKETELLKEQLNDKIYEILTTCRSKLFNNLLLKNRALLDEKKLMEVGQKILDRFVFIRFAEDNNLFGKNVLKTYLANWQGLPERQKERTPLMTYVLDLFDYIRAGSTAEGIFPYNGGLFETDELVEKMDVDNDILENIIESIIKYEDGNQIDFSEIPIDILGHIYEKYLSLSLSIKEQETGFSLTEETTKKVRKKTGIYYTPKYIVNFIIEKTINKKLEDSLENLSNVKVLDPACGSGTFLGSAYDSLYMKTIEYNAIIEAKSSAKDIKENLTKYLESMQPRKAEFNKKILSSNLYGVDINPESIEITKMSLWFKTAQKDIPLNNLEDHIKCGDSLIDDINLSKDHAFDWKNNFPEVFNKENPGFDVIIGNPPYFKIKNDDPITQTEDYKEISIASTNAAAVFLNRCLKMLKNHGILGFIVPKQLAFTNSWQNLRKKIFSDFKIHSIIDCHKAFKDVKLEQVIVILEKDNDNKDNFIKLGKVTENDINITGEISQEICRVQDRIILDYNPIIENIKSKIETNSAMLEELADFQLGLGIQELKEKGVFNLTEKEGNLKAIGGNDIQRYFIRNWNYFDPEDPLLSSYRDRIIFPPKKKIVAQRIVAHIRDHIKITSAIDEVSSLSFNTVLEVFPKHEDDFYYILGLLNSDLISYYVYKFIYNNAIRSMDFYPAYAKEIRVLKIEDEEKKQIDAIVKKLIEMHENLLFFKDKVQRILGKYAGYKKIGFKTVLNENFNTLVGKERKIKVKEIRVEIDSDMLIIVLNNKKFIKIQINDELKRTYIAYFIESIDPDTLNIEDTSIIDALSNLEMDDFDSQTSLKIVVEELEKIELKSVLTRKVNELEVELNDLIFSLYKLSPEEIKYISDSFL